jgi:hypothetical protein
MDVDPLEPYKAVEKSAVVRVADLGGLSFQPRSYAG